MRENLFELGSSLDNFPSWKSDNKTKITSTCKDKKPFNEHSLVFKIEKRKGKTVSIIGEFFLQEETLKGLCKKWKKTLGVGGTYKDGFMEFQGQCCDKLKTLARQEGFKTKS
jgi:translation initiation factor 1